MCPAQGTLHEALHSSCRYSTPVIAMYCTLLVGYYSPLALSI